MIYNKVKVFYLCGHSADMILNKDEIINNNKIVRCEKSLCVNCKERERLMDCIYSTMQKAVELGLPELCGTFDQIILANQIRMKFIEEYIVIKEKDMRSSFKKYCNINEYDINEMKTDINKEGNLKRLFNFIIYNITDAKIWEESINDYNSLLYIGGFVISDITVCLKQDYTA